MKGREFGVLSILVILMVVLMTSGVQGQYDEEPPSYSYDNLPQTRFTCEGRQAGRYYADQDTQCQMFHICVQMNHKTIQDFKFLCPNGTVFDQEHLVCVEYYQVVCHTALGTNPLGQHLEIFKLSAAKPSLSLLSSSSVPIRDPEYLGQNTLGGGDDIFQVEEYNNNKFIKANSLSQAFPAKSSRNHGSTTSSGSTKPITTSTTTTSTTTTTTTRIPTTITTTTTTSQPLLFRSPIIPHDRDREIFPVRINPQAQNVQQSQSQSQQRTTNHQANTNNNNNNNNNQNQNHQSRGRETFASRNLATDQSHGQNAFRNQNQQRHQNQHQQQQNQRSNLQQQQQNNNQRSKPQLIRPSPQQNNQQSFQPILLSSPPEFQGIPFNFPQPGSGNNNFRLQIQATTQRPTTGVFQSTFRTSLPLQGTQQNPQSITQSTKIPTFQQQSSRFSDEFFVKLPSTKRPFFSIDTLNDFTARGFKDQLVQSQLRQNNQNQNQNQSPTSATIPLGFTFSPDLKSSSTNNFMSFPPTTQTPFVKPTTFNPTSFQRSNGQFKVQKMDHSSNAHFLVNANTNSQQQSSEYSRSTTEDYSGSGSSVTSSGSSGSSTRDYTSESQDADETYGPTLQYYEPTKSPSNHVNSILNADDEIIGFETTIPSTSTTTTTTSTTEKPSKRGGRRRLKQRQRKYRPQFDQQFGQFQSQSRRRPFKESNEKFLKSNSNGNIDEIFKAEASVHGHGGSKNLFLTSDEKRKEDTSSVERQQNFSPEFVHVDNNNGPPRDKLGVIRVQTKKPNSRGDSFGRRIRPFVRDHAVLIEAGQQQQEELGPVRKPIIVRRRRPTTTQSPPTEVNSTTTVTSISSSTSSSSEHSTVEPEIYSPKRNQSLLKPRGDHNHNNATSQSQVRVRTQTSFSHSTSVTSSTSSSKESRLQVTTEEPELITASDEDIELIRKLKKEEKRVNQSQSVSNSTSRISSSSTGFKVSVKSKLPLLKPKSQKFQFQQKESSAEIDVGTTYAPISISTPQKKKTIKIIKKVIKAESSGLSDEIELGEATFAPTLSPDYDYAYFNTDDEIEIIDKEQAKQSKVFGKKANGKGGKIVKIKRTVKS